MITSMMKPFMKKELSEKVIHFVFFGIKYLKKTKTVLEKHSIK